MPPARPIDVPSPPRPTHEPFRRGRALRVASRLRAAAPAVAQSDPEAVLQSRAARRSAARPGAARQPRRRARGRAAHAAGRVERAALRDPPATRHRGLTGHASRCRASRRARRVAGGEGGLQRAPLTQRGELVHQVRPGLRPTEASASTEPVRALPARSRWGRRDSDTAIAADRRFAGRHSAVAGAGGEAGGAGEVRQGRGGQPQPTPPRPALPTSRLTMTRTGTPRATRLSLASLWQAPDASGGDSTLSNRRTHSRCCSQPSVTPPPTRQRLFPRGRLPGPIELLAAATQPTPPRDEPAPAAPVDHAEPGPPDR